jgi:hypothetical protein
MFRRTTTTASPTTVNHASTGRGHSQTSQALCDRFPRLSPIAARLGETRRDANKNDLSGRLECARSGRPAGSLRPSQPVLCHAARTARIARRGVATYPSERRDPNLMVRPARRIGVGRAKVGKGGRGPIGGTSLSCGISSSGRGWRADGKSQPSRTVIPATDKPRFPGRRPGGIPAPAVRPARPRLHAAPAHGPPAGRPGTGSPAAPLRRPPRGGRSTRGVRQPAHRPEGS